MPASGATFTFDYDEAVPITDTVSPSGSTVNFTLSTTPVKAGGVQISVPLQAQSIVCDDAGNTPLIGPSDLPARTVTVTDDGAGNLSGGGISGGTIDYRRAP